MLGVILGKKFSQTFTEVESINAAHNLAPLDVAKTFTASIGTVVPGLLLKRTTDNHATMGMIPAVIAGGAAGNHTVTGILTTDVLKQVIQVGSGVTIALVTGGVAGNHTLTGITTADKLLFVGHFSTEAAIATLGDLTGEFTIDSANTIDNAGGTDTSSDQLMVLWQDASAQHVDLTSEFSIDSANTIDNAGGTATTGDQLYVIYERPRAQSGTFIPWRQDTDSVDLIAGVFAGPNDLDTATETAGMVRVFGPLRKAKLVAWTGALGATTADPSAAAIAHLEEVLDIFPQ